MKKNKKIYMMIIISLVCIILLTIYFIQYDFLQEDLLFFQLFHLNTYSNDSSENNTSQIRNTQKNAHMETISFCVQNQNKKLKALNLNNTVNNQTLVNEKIAPGTSGRFDIVLKSYETLNYKIDFKSENKKPTNLRFFTSENKTTYNTLEELGKSLTGIIFHHEEKTIPIYWQWDYEIDHQQNEQDTLDAEEIKEYRFLIYVQGY